VINLAKRKKASRNKKGGLYRAETYGIKYNSNTFLIFLAFVAIVAMMLVASIMGFKLY
jgi:hypothetical protein